MGKVVKKEGRVMMTRAPKEEVFKPTNDDKPSDENLARAKYLGILLEETEEG
jgi:hypothetical protein